MRHMTTVIAAPLMSREDYRSAVDTALQACAAYYADGTSPLDDATYDLLAGRIRDYKLEHSEDVREDSPRARWAVVPPRRAMSPTPFPCCPSTMCSAPRNW